MLSGLSRSHLVLKNILATQSPCSSIASAGLNQLLQQCPIPQILPQVYWSKGMSSNTRNAPGWDPVARPFPPSHRSNHSEIFKSAKDGEVKVEDPYHWLEIPPSESEQSKAWVTAQAEFTDAYAKQCKDRTEMKKRLELNLDYPRYTTPGRTGRQSGQVGDYYYSHNSGLEPQASFYKASNEDLLKAEQTKYSTPPGQKWFDQNLLSSDGTVAVSSLAFSKSGKYLAYCISKSGSDWSTCYFRETSKPFVTPAENDKVAAEGGPDRFDDVVEYLKYTGPCWTHDETGVFYKRYPAPKSNKQQEAEGGGDHGTSTDASIHAELFYHKLGTSQKDDILVISRDEKIATSMFYPSISEDGKWLIVTHSIDTDTKARTFLASLDQPIGPDMKWICLVPKFEYQLGYLINDGNDFYFETNKGAPNSKIVRVRIDPSSARAVKHITEMTEEATYEDVVKEDKQAPLRDIAVINGDKLLVVYSRDVKDELWQLELKTGEKLRRLLPDFVGTINRVHGRAVDDEAFITSTSFTNPGIVHRMTWPAKSDAQAEPSVKLHRTANVKGIDSTKYESKQVFITSKDGTKVPVFLTYRKDTKLDGTAPAWLYFYGGFNIPLPPQFSATLMTWVGAYGGVLAWVNARGGGEYGDAWHDAGRLFNKQNVFDDAISAAEYLVAEKIAAKGKIIVNGGSNGGLGAMAVGNQAPEGLLGGVVAEVGVLDMLRFMHFTAGKFWVADYGNPAEDPAMFDYVYKYSPLHNVDAKKVYPTVLLMSGDHDDRVSPLHTFKMAAELQHRLPKNPNPILARLELKAGHGAGKSTQKIIEEASDKFCITARALGLEMKPLPDTEMKARQ